MVSVRVKEKLFHQVGVIHFRLFGHEMSDEMRKFLGNLSWSFFGGITAGGILFITNILAGRWLGPEEYGKYNFIAAFSTIALLLMNFGLDVTTLHFVSRARSSGERELLIGTSFFSILFTILLGILILVGLADFFVDELAVDSGIYFVAIIFTTVLSIKNLLDSYLRGIGLFKEQSRYKILEACLTFGALLTVLLSGIFVGHLSYLAYVSSLFFGTIVIIFFILCRVKEYLQFKNFSVVTLKSMFWYGLFVLIGGVSSLFLLNLDKIFVNKYLGIEQLGLYGAYYTASMTLTTYASLIFLNVFFPAVSGSNLDLETILTKLNTLTIRLFLPAFLLIAMCTRGALLLFGDAYPVDWLLILEFSLLSVIFSYFTIVWWLVAAAGTRGMAFTSLAGFIIGISFIFTMVLSQSILSMHLTVVYLIISAILGGLLGNFAVKSKFIN